MQRTEVNSSMRWLRIGLAWAAIAGFGISHSRAQSADVTDTQIIVETQEHWAQWSRPEHVLDLVDGQVRPHFFRHVYNILAEDQASFRRPIDAPRIRGADRTIRTVDRTPVIDREGKLKLAEEKIGKYLDQDFGRIPSDVTRIVLAGDLFTITDTTMNGDKEVALALRNERTGVRSRQTFETKSKEQFPEYAYFVRPGISRAGSNVDSAAYILDGDPSTYWEPDLADTSDNWWVEIDLGRVVVVEKVVLHFVDEAEGDPFRQFRVLASPEQRVLLTEESEFGSTNEYQWGNFSVVGGTIAPNTEQRVFELTAQGEPRFVQPGTDPSWTGRLVETIRVLVTDSKRFRGRQVTPAAWEALPAGERGEIVYYIRDEAGFEEPVAQEIYESLGPQRQGRQEYYVRERPRLSEVEVWGWGDNLSPGVLGPGGAVDMTGPYKAGSGFDADFGSSFRFLVWSPYVSDRAVMTVDLGALMWLDNIRVASAMGISRKDGTFIEGYIVRGSDGSRDATGALKWRRVSPREREDNLINQFVFISDIYDPPVKLRYLEMRNTTTNYRAGGYSFELGELLMYSAGYVAEASITSGFIRLPGPRNLGAIRWSPDPEQQPPGTEVEIRTRTGDLLVENIRYLTSTGIDKKTFEEWDELPPKFRGPIDTSFAVGSGWSAWSRPNLQPGDHVTSPSLRQFMQIEARLITHDRQKAATLSSIEVEMFDPVARSLTGEIWPQQATAGLRDTFDIYLNSTFVDAPSGLRTPGFDEVRLQGPAELDLRLVGVRSGTEAEFLQQQPYQVFEPTGEIFASAAGDTLELLERGGGAVGFRMPALMQSAPAELVPKRYHRITGEGDQVVVGHDGEVMSEAAYGLLPEDERGQILFFQRITDDSGQVRLEKVADFAYDELPAGEQGPIRYFRKLSGAGAEFPFAMQADSPTNTVPGDTLTKEAYDRLPRSERGTTRGGGRLLQVRVAATVFLNTTLQALVRKSDQLSPAGEPVWQQVDGGDATALTEGRGLSLSVPVGGKVLDDVVLTPNPFTPNGDGINDELTVSFSVFQVTADRQVRLRIYRLDGRRVWEGSELARGGAHALRWSGVDHAGLKVPPGLYICQLHLDVDADDSANMTLSRIVAVAY